MRIFIHNKWDATPNVLVDLPPHIARNDDTLVYLVKVLYENTKPRARP
jgi:hypothetical protein